MKSRGLFGQPGQRTILGSLSIKQSGNQRLLAMLLWKHKATVSKAVSCHKQVIHMDIAGCRIVSRWQGMTSTRGTRVGPLRAEKANKGEMTPETRHTHMPSFPLRKIGPTMTCGVKCLSRLHFPVDVKIRSLIPVLNPSESLV